MKNRREFRCVWNSFHGKKYHVLDGNDVELSADGSLDLYGRNSEFVGPSPEDSGVDMRVYGYPVVPYISDKTFKIK